MATKKKTIKKAAPKRAKAAKVTRPAKAAKRTKAPKAARASSSATIATAPAKVVKSKIPAGDRAMYKQLLLDLRDHLLDRINFLAGDNLNRSQRESSGDLSAYGFHMADAGTDNFDREFALSMVSSEQDGLYEVEEALKRLEAGLYGICEMCEKPIAKPRLQAVPFTRLCVTCQASTERGGPRMARAMSSFSERPEDEPGEDEDEKEKETT